MGYDIESYWSRVAAEIERRGAGRYVAGDDDPYYRYKRAKFVRRFLATLDVAGRRVLELGCGPGGNLVELARLRPAAIIGVDISGAMLDLAGRAVAHIPVPSDLRKTDGKTLPIDTRGVDVAFTVTVLQHNVDPGAFGRAVAELCRVTADRIVVMEDVGETRSTPERATFIARPVDVYQTRFAAHGFNLTAVTPLNLYYSRRLHSAICKRLVPSTHREGEPLSTAVKGVLASAVAITRLVDDIRADVGDLTRMVFVRAGDRRHPSKSRTLPG